MADSNSIKVFGKIKSIINSFTYKVTLENGVEMQVVSSGNMKRFRAKFLPGDEVVVEISNFDMSKGRIVERKK
ncbi:MAG: translation initiation factor IF-1 [Mycoplasmataceae bacterium]|nr:translation initiation factor IF-1 [Mycoplasmataceae bacterium]